MKKILLQTLLIFGVVANAFAQVEDSPMPQGLLGQAIMCQRNSSGATLTSADGDASYVGCTATGAILTTNDSTVAEDSAIASGDKGTVILGKYSSAPTNSAGTSGDAASIHTNDYGAVWVSLTPGGSNSSGWTPKLANALSTTVVSVKSSAGQFGGFYCYNPAAAVTYVQVFNTASGSVTLGTTTPSLSLGVPAGGGAVHEFANGISNFGTAISVAATTTATGSSAPASAIDCNFLYK